MKPHVVLEPVNTQTAYVPLGVLGYCLTRTQFFAPLWNDLPWAMKTVVHTPAAKLQDLLVSILAGNTSILQINTRLRPDSTLAQAWGRPVFAEQSSIAYTLDALGPDQLAHLRAGSQALFCLHSQTVQHDFRQHWLVLDIDPTGLLASRAAEGSCKGYFANQRDRFGRHWQRVSVPTYHETLGSWLYPGNQQAATTLKPAIRAVQDFLGLTADHRRRTIVRSDASLGTDGNINWLLWQNYQVLMKGFSGPRAVNLAQQIAEPDWLADLPRQRWIAPAVTPPRYMRRTNVLVVRWQGKTKLRYGTLVSTLFQLDPLATCRFHDGRGAVEVEIKADKHGLRVPHRRKKSFAAQEGLILLTDVAHNLLSWFHHWVLEQTPFVAFGTQRLVDELLCIPGRLEFRDNHLCKVALLETHPYAAPMRLVLTELLNCFGNP